MATSPERDGANRHFGTRLGFAQYARLAIRLHSEKGARLFPDDDDLRGYFDDDLRGYFNGPFSKYVDDPFSLSQKRNRLPCAALPRVLRLSAYAGVGMTTGEVAAQYRGYAAKCLLLAQNQTVDEKLALIDMAQAWITLAEQVEKNESLLVIYETPAKPTQNL